MKNIGCWLLVSLAIVGCNDGGQSLPSGKQCTKSQKPVNMGVDEKLKIDLKAQEALDKLPAGEYNYTGAAVYYEDDFTKTKLYFVDSKPEGQKEYKGRVECFRNYMTFPGMDEKISAVSHMTIANNREIFIDTKTFRLAFEGNRRIFEVNPGEEKQNKSPKSPYEDSAAEEFFMVEVKPGVHYHIRASYKVNLMSEDGKPLQRGTLYVATGLKRTELPTYSGGH